MTLKLNIADVKAGKTVQKDLSEEYSAQLMGKKIGDKFSGSPVGFSGYEFQITGGSDDAGFPMRWDVAGSRRKKILTTKGIGFKTNEKGLRKRVTVAGNEISSHTVQVNVKVVKYGKNPLNEVPAAPEEEASAEAPKEAKPDEKKVEASKKEDKPEAPKGKAKPEVKEAPAGESKKE